VLLLLCLPSCAWLPIAPRAIGRCPGPLVSTRDIEGSFVLQHRLRVRAEGVDFPLQTVLQKQDEELVFIGMSPLGAKLFTLKQHETDTEVDALPAAVLPIPPLNLLSDLHRLLYPEKTKESDAQVEVLRHAGGAHALVRHERCGYTLEVETLGARSLP